MAFPPQSPQRSLHPPDLHLHLNKLRKVLTCSLCHQLFQKPACLHCNHHFCMSCLLQAMEEMSACPKCKQPAATRQAIFAPEMDMLVEIFQSLETASGPIIANSEDSHLENVPDVTNEVFVKTEDECLSPSALKRQRRHENREGVLNVSMGATEADSRKRDASSMDQPCRGILPAPKRIQLPCPPFSADKNDALDANLEKTEMDLSTHPTLETSSTVIDSNPSQEQQKQPVFAHATIGGISRSKASIMFSHDEKVLVPMGIQGSYSEQPDASGNSVGKSNECAALHSNDQSQERIGMHVDQISQGLHPPRKEEVEWRATCTQDQLAVGNDRLNATQPNQADQGTDKVTCAFCHKSDSQVAGPMIHYKKGVPVSGSKRSGQIFSVHKNCAEWAPGVYYEDDVAKNIPQEVARGHKIKCHVCGLRGAVLGCYVKRCRKSFHYPCAQSLPCRWDDRNFLVFCPEHVNSRFPDEGPQSSHSKLSNVPNQGNLVSQGHKEERSRQALSADGCGHQSKIVVPAAAAAVDAYIPGLPKDAETRNEELPRQLPASNWVLCGSGLSPKANELMATFVSNYGVTMERTWTPSVTHLIVGTDEVGAARRTFKYLMANLEGKWILKVDWLSACMAANRYIHEEPYEITLDIHGLIGGPRRARGMGLAKVHRLFEGLRFYFLGEYAAGYMADLEALITTAGGLALSKMPDLRDRDMKACLIIIYNKDIFPDTSASLKEELNRSRYLEAKSLASAIDAKVAGHTWILDSVAAYELQPFE